MNSSSYFAAGAGAGAGAGAQAASSFQINPAAQLPSYLRAVQPAVDKRNAKRARVEEDDSSEEEKTGEDCPRDMEAVDFEKLKQLVTKHRQDPMLSLLPMPKAAYSALGVPEPKVASVMEVAWNCLFKPSTHQYTTNEVEVRDLSKTHTAADFPSFYEGPSHPHMRPEGGIAVIEHDAASSSSSSAGAGAGAGAGSAMTDD